MLLTPVLVSCPCPRGPARGTSSPDREETTAWVISVASAGVASGSVDGSIAQPRDAEEPDDDADREDPPVLEHEAVADDRQAEREDSGQYDGDGMWMLCGSKSTGVRSSIVAGAARGQLHQPALVVLGVLAVPELVAVRDDRDLGEVVLGRRRRRHPLERARVPRVVPRPSGRAPAV